MAEQKMPEKMEKVDIPLLEVKPSNNNNKAEEVSRRGMTGVYEAVAGVLGAPVTHSMISQN